MQICIWYEITESAWGGSNSFLRSLSKQLIRLGYRVTNTPNPTDDIVLINSWSRGLGKLLKPVQVKYIQSMGHRFRLEILLHKIKSSSKSRGVPVVHRLDGVASLYGRKDSRADTIQCQLASMVDQVIFQSHYSQASFASFGVFPKNARIIHNAVDGSIFFPSNTHRSPQSKLRLMSVSWSQNPMKGFEWLSKISAIPNVELCFVGNWCKSIDPGNVHLLGVRNAEEIAELLRNSDIFVHAAENDPCSNSIVEALASGLPILYHGSGGNPELAGGFGLPLGDNFKDVIAELHTRYGEFREKVIEHRPLFLIETATQKYLNVFRDVLGKNG